MPKVPSDIPYADSGAIGALSPVRGVSPGEAAFPGQQIQEFGRSLTGLGSQAMGAATEMQDYVNQVQVMDATNQARAKVLDLTYGKDEGYHSITGKAAIDPQGDGSSLPDYYANKLRSAIGEISQRLGNERQRQDFSLRADEIETTFKGQVQAHLQREFKSHTLSVADGAIMLGTDQAKRNWNDENKISPNVLQVKTAIVRAGQIAGWSADEIIAKQQIATSNIHAGVVDAALKSGATVYAAEYVQKHSAEMTADDLLKVGGSISSSIDQSAASEAVEIETRNIASAIRPVEFDRAFNVLKMAESSNRQFDKNGKVITSKAGAVGIAQIMPKTGPEAAKLAGLPWDENRLRTDPAYNEALGRAYLAKNLKTFGGNLPLAYAAYNAWEGTVKTAMKMASLEGNPDGWIKFVPTETQAYVRKNMKAYNAGAGAPEMPTELQFVSRVVDRLGPNVRPEAKRLAASAAEHRYRLLEKERKDRDEASVANAMRELESNGGRMSALSLETRAALPPKEIDNLLQYGARIAKGDDITNPAVYLKLADPAFLKGLSDDAFYRFRTELSQSDFQHYAREKARLQADKKSADPGDLDSGAINSVLRDRIVMMGRDPTPKDGSAEAQVIGAMHKTVRDSILAEQIATGKKLSDAQIVKHIDRLFATSVSFRNTFLGMDVGRTSGRLMAMTAADIPSDIRDSLKRDFAARGIDSPSNADLLGAYWRLKLAQ